MTFVWALAAFQQSAPVATGSGRIHGNVVTDQTGSPIRGADVTCTAGLSKWIAATDDNGRFDIPDLPAGAYMVRVSKAGFVEAAPPNVVLKDKTTSELKDVRLHRGGVIAGRVMNAQGEPIVDANVAVSLVDPTLGNRMLMASQSTRTDDLGSFRLFGLPPGSYFVHVGAVGDPRLPSSPGPTEARMRSLSR